MVDLDKIILVCNQALEDSEDSFSNSLPFFEMADPQSVLELVRLVEANTVSQELDRLLTLIRDLSACLQSVPDEVCPMVGPAKQEMLSQANCVLAIYEN